MVRDVVKKQAPWYVYSMQDLIDELQKAPKKESSMYNGRRYPAYGTSVKTPPTQNAAMVTALAAN